MTLPLSLQGSVHFSACFSELKLDEANLRRQLRCLDDERSRKRRAFVVMVGVDRCIFSGSFLCKVSCEEHEETFKSRVARKRGRYGATAWWRRAVEESSPSAAEGHAESEEQDGKTMHPRRCSL
eukprot:g12872.t1